MCTPVMIAAAALEVGSIAAGQMATNAQTRARNDVLAAERIRQHGFDQQATALNNTSRERYNDFVPHQTAEADRLASLFQTSVAPDPNASAGTILPSSSSGVVNQEIAKQRGNAQTFVDQQGHARADMKSFGDLLGDISTGQARDASQIGQINGFKQGSQGIVPLELQHAGEAGDNWQLLSAILGGLGDVGMSAGVNGGSSDAIMNFFKKPTAKFPGATGGVAPPAPFFGGGSGLLAVT